MFFKILFCNSFLLVISKFCLGKICPLGDHIVCNSGYHKCICGLSNSQEVGEKNQVRSKEGKMVNLLLVSTH